MKLKRIILIILLFIAFFQICFGQEVDFEGNWFREIRGYDDYLSSYDFKFYTKEDVVKAKGRFNLIKQTPFENEWEGIYSHGAMTRMAQLHWSSAGGFAYFDVYHTLRRLDFGNAIDQADSVNLMSEKSASSRKSMFSTNLIKVKFGDRHFLIPENRLADFAERTVGLSTVLEDYEYYLEKLDEAENKVFGLPILPKKYEKFLRFPIDTKIIAIGKREIYQVKFDDGRLNYEEIYRFVIFGAGKNKNIKSV